MLKFTGLSCLSILATQSTFGPSDELIPQVGMLERMIRQQYGLGRPKTYTNGPDYIMGADSLASSILYFACIYGKLWTPTLIFITIDFMYYGPQCLGGPLAAVIGAVTLI